MLPEGPASQLNGRLEFLRMNGTKDHVENSGKQSFVDISILESREGGKKICMRGTP